MADPGAGPGRGKLLLVVLVLSSCLLGALSQEETCWRTGLPPQAFGVSQWRCPAITGVSCCSPCDGVNLGIEALATNVSGVISAVVPQFSSMLPPSTTVSGHSNKVNMLWSRLTSTILVQRVVTS